MRFPQLVSYSGYSGVFSFGYVFHKCQAGSDCHSRRAWQEDLMNNGTKINLYVNICKDFYFRVC